MRLLSRFTDGFAPFKVGVRVVRGIVRSVSSLVKKADYIVFCSDRYNENSRYLYEYLVSAGWGNVFWVSYDRRVICHLRERGLPVLSGVFERVWYLMRAKVVIASGTQFWDRYGAVGKGTIKYCLMHGSGPKVTEYYDDFERSVFILRLVNSFDYVSFPSAYSAQVIGRCIYKLPNHKILVNGYPRVDQLKGFPTRLAPYTREDAEKEFGVSLNDNSFLVVYTPTFRKYNKSYAFPLADLPGYSKEEFARFLEENNIILFYSKHPHSFERSASKWEGISNVIRMDVQNKPFFDITRFYGITNALINDYSTSSVDYLLTGNPQIFVIPDYDEVIKKDGFLEDYSVGLPGPIVKDFNELKEVLLKAKDTTVATREAPHNSLKKYCDDADLSAGERHMKFLSSLVGTPIGGRDVGD